MDMRFFTDYFGVRVGVERYEQLEKYVVCRVQSFNSENNGIM